jgi:hypothetical protein
VPPAFNVVLIVLRTTMAPLAARLVLDLPSFQSVSSFNNDIAELYSHGRSVLLSIGGSNDMGVHMTTSARVTEILQPERPDCDPRLRWDRLGPGEHVPDKHAKSAGREQSVE